MSEAKKPRTVAFYWAQKAVTRYIRSKISPYAGAYSVYNALVETASDAGSDIFKATHEHLASVCGLSRRKIQDEIEALKRLNIIAVETPKLRAPCTYTLHAFNHAASQMDNSTRKLGRIPIALVESPPDAHPERNDAHPERNDAQKGPAPNLRRSEEKGRVAPAPPSAEGQLKKKNQDGSPALAKAAPLAFNNKPAPTPPTDEQEVYAYATSKKYDRHRLTDWIYDQEFERKIVSGIFVDEKLKLDWRDRLDAYMQHREGEP